MITLPRQGRAMAEHRKSDGRRERSRLTRARIVEAASGLLVERGYVATTIEDVAEFADVAVQTVYYVFGTKHKLLAAVLDASIVGDVDPVPVLEREWIASLREEHDADAAIEHLVADTVDILRRTSPIYEVVRRAAADPDVSSLLQETRRRRRADQRALIEILFDSASFRAAVELDTAADVVYGVLNEEVFQLFVGDCAWTIDRFRRWATDFMLQQLTGAVQ